MPFADYLRELQKDLKGRATERTYYPALKSLLEALEPGAEVAARSPGQIAFRR